MEVKYEMAGYSTQKSWSRYIKTKPRKNSKRLLKTSLIKYGKYVLDVLRQMEHVIAVQTLLKKCLYVTATA